MALLEVNFVVNNFLLLFWDLMNNMLPIFKHLTVLDSENRVTFLMTFVFGLRPFRILNFIKYLAHLEY